MGDLRSAIAAQEFASKEDLEAFVANYAQQANQGPVDDFLGLSSQQMRRIMSGTLDDIPELLTLSTSISAFEVREAPIMKQVQFVIAWIRANGGQIRKTTTGNFPRDLSQAFQARFHSNDAWLTEPVRSENELWDLIAIHDFLYAAGYLHETKAAIRLTEKGQTWTQHSAQAYIEAFGFITDRFEWSKWVPLGFGAEVVALCRDTAAFSLLLLKKLGTRNIDSEDMYQVFLSAFPQIGPPPNDLEGFDMAYALYRTLIIEHYLSILGLIDYKDPPLDWKKGNIDPKFRPSKLFANAIRWTVAVK